MYEIDLSAAPSSPFFGWREAIPAGSGAKLFGRRLAARDKLLNILTSSALFVCAVIR